MNQHVANLTPSRFSRWPVIVIGATLLTVIVLVAAVRLSGTDIRNPDAAAVVVRELRFEDRPDGSVAVIDAVQNKVIHSVTGEAGFLRGTLRGFARDRRARGLGPEQAFHLIGRADGRLTLFDPATGRIVDLESFGPTNSAVFAGFLLK
jgi:putative photosynthetic complex assembly protein